MMRAAVFYGERDLRIDKRPRPVPRAGQVLLKVLACGVCGTDHHIYHGDFETHPPVVIGHEYTGEVVAVGDGVEDLAVGDRVAIDPNISCGRCRYCQRGAIHMCEWLTALGVDIDGGFAEYSLAPRAQCYPFDENLSAVEAAMTEPLACCVHGIDLAEIAPGDRVAVIGGGAIGLMLAQLARFSGASQVLVSDPLSKRRQLALELGADAVVDPLLEDPLASGGCLRGGADVVIEAVGSKDTTRQAIDWAARGATVLWFGVTPPGQTVPVEPNLLFRKELTVRGARINPHTHSRALALLESGRVQVAPLITDTIALERLPELLDNGSGQAIKTVVVP